jgi:hypothetical protein
MRQRNRNKTMSKKEKNEGREKSQFDKRRKDNKTLSQKNENETEKKNFDRRQKKKEPKIKVPAHKLLASTLSYPMLAPW